MRVLLGSSSVLFVGIALGSGCAPASVEHEAGEVKEPRSAQGLHVESISRVAEWQLGGDGGLRAKDSALVLPSRPTARRSEMSIDCRQKSHAISPLIYGIAYSPMTDAQDDHVWQMRPTARRWGGNHTSRYNWRLGNAWNTAYDWFFRNVNYTGDPAFSWRMFLSQQRRHEVATALTMPMLGWVARDTDSVSFPVEVYGPQEQVDPYRPNAGNGRTPDGHELAPGDPRRTSIEMPPSEIASWVQQIREVDRRQGGRSVQLYLLDNEPSLWNSTHRDVHPHPVGYDELLERTLAYAGAIRRADPQAVIGGPSEWGWPSYFFSAVDAKYGFFLKPDRRLHGDVPLLAWYLRALRKHERETGVRLLDVLNVHYYPQDLPKTGRDPELQARRLRATRSLWDPSYRDESWIDEAIELLPRLSRLVAENYPGLGISIGEYNFGGEDDPSGALALAEVLGRFGQHEGLTAAFYWTYPAKGSPAYQAFRAYRNFDGNGGRFLDYSVATQAGAATSLFASRDARKRQLVAVALNLSPDEPQQGTIRLLGCGSVTAVRSFQYTSTAADLVQADQGAAAEGPLLRAELPPYSITVLDLKLAP